MDPTGDRSISLLHAHFIVTFAPTFVMNSSRKSETRPLCSILLFQRVTPNPLPYGYAEANRAKDYLDLFWDKTVEESRDTHQSRWHPTVASIDLVQILQPGPHP